MSYSNGPRIVTDGLVLCLDAGNPKSYPGVGTLWNNLASTNHNFSLVFAPFATIDNVKCINCTWGYAYDPGVGYLLPNSHTLISWARALSDNEVNNWRTLWRTQPDDHQLLISNNSNTIGYYDNNGGNFVSYGLNLGTLGLENKWTMFTLVGHNNTTTLYINNLSSSGIVNYSAHGNYVDAFGAAIGSQYFGYIAIAQIYSRNLTNEEISQNYNALKGRFNS